MVSHPSILRFFCSYLWFIILLTLGLCSNLLVQKATDDLFCDYANQFHNRFLHIEQAILHVIGKMVFGAADEDLKKAVISNCSNKIGELQLPSGSPEFRKVTEDLLSSNANVRSAWGREHGTSSIPDEEEVFVHFRVLSANGQRRELNKWCYFWHSLLLRRWRKWNGDYLWCVADGIRASKVRGNFYVRCKYVSRKDWRNACCGPFDCL